MVFISATRRSDNKEVMIAIRHVSYITDNMGHGTVVSFSHDSIIVNETVDQIKALIKRICE